MEVNERNAGRLLVAEIFLWLFGEKLTFHHICELSWFFSKGKKQREEGKPLQVIALHDVLSCSSGLDSGLLNMRPTIKAQVGERMAATWIADETVSLAFVVT